jgi:hypothetical protein
MFLPVCANFLPCCARRDGYYCYHCQ